MARSDGGERPRPEIPRFDRRAFDGTQGFTRLGDGSLGGKAQGLAAVRDVLASRLDPREFPGLTVAIPDLLVLATDVFDAFMAQNDLWPVARGDGSDEEIAHAFQRGRLPVEYVGDLRALIAQTRVPLAVRSSSLLEDAMFEPFAGVYATKMIPNNQPETDARFQRLVEAIKFVYASTFFRGARAYRRATRAPDAEEKMAVVVQEVVGRRFGERFYPHVAGVIRSWNFYPTGAARPEEGVVDLALGLGKTIVDGGRAWTYSPAHPAAAPPFASAAARLKQTQTRFWAVNMGRPPAFDPIRETEYLVEAGLSEAEYDGALDWLVSTYDAESDRLVLGAGRPGPRVVDFAPLLQLDELPLNALVRRLLPACEEAVGQKVEIEFALSLDPRGEDPARFGFLQVRPMVVSQAEVDVADEELGSEAALVASEQVMGNGLVETIRDVVYVRPEAFEAAATRRIAGELEELNRPLAADGRPYLLLGFGRWGSSDPWLGIPVEWSQIAGARAIVEATLPEMNVERSQGSHFFHNITSFQVFYFQVHHAGPHRVDWAWLDGQPAAAQTEHCRRVSLAIPLTVKVDGRTGRGVILRGG